MDEKVMDKLLYSVLTQDEKPSEELNRTVKAKIAKKNRKHIRHNMEIAAGFLLLFIFMGTVVFHSQMQAVMQRIFGSITEYYGDNLTRNQKEQTEEEIYKVGDTVTNQRVGITLQEVLVDANKVVFSAKIHIPDQSVKLTDEMDVKANVYIDGKKLDATALGTPVEKTKDGIVCVGEAGLNSDMVLKGNVNVKIVITRIGFMPPLEGDWVFDMVVNVDTANRHTTQDSTKYKVPLTDGTILYIEKMVRTSTDCRLYGMIEGDLMSGKKKKTISIDGVDDLGNEVHFNQIKLGNKKKNMQNITILCEENISEEAEYLVVKPSLLGKKKKHVMVYATGKEFRMKVGK